MSMPNSHSRTLPLDGTSPVTRNLSLKAPTGRATAGGRQVAINSETHSIDAVMIRLTDEHLLRHPLGGKLKSPCLKLFMKTDEIIRVFL